MQGQIKKLTDKGFGFIISDELEKDIFFHSSELQGASFEELNEGDNVTFEMVKTDKGLNAVGVAKA